MDSDYGDGTYFQGCQASGVTRTVQVFSEQVCVAAANLLGVVNDLGNAVFTLLNAAAANVNAGDIITADEDGVAVVPRARADEVLKKAQALDDTEHSMLPFIEKFRSIKEAVAKFGRI